MRNSRLPSSTPLIDWMALTIKFNITCCSWTRSPWTRGKPSPNCVRIVRRARNGAQHFRDGRLLLDEFGHPILQLRSGPFCLDILVHAEQFLGLDGEDNITAPATVRDSSL